MNISCVVTAHRELHLIYPTLKSVFRSVDYAKQYGISTEIIVTLDKSDETTSEIVSRELQGKGKIERVDYGDLALSRNHAVDVAKGSYIAFLDADDLWGENWITNAFFLSEGREEEIVCHPQYCIYFGQTQYIFEHIDMESRQFVPDFLYYTNYWTALSFGKVETYKKFPYMKNEIEKGFGYEDWTWNVETVKNGILHKTVPGTAHAIRRGKTDLSLLDKTNMRTTVPRIYPMYRRSKAA
ncbi:MAG: glycosyltransferase [Gammaproteobacteria bacterium]|nr:glycosyltransferase [Gammaproteobacteria bacterium]